MATPSRKLPEPRHEVVSWVPQIYRHSCNCVDANHCSWQSANPFSLLQWTDFDLNWSNSWCLKWNILPDTSQPHRAIYLACCFVSWIKSIKCPKGFRSRSQLDSKLRGGALGTRAFCWFMLFIQFAGCRKSWTIVWVQSWFLASSAVHVCVFCNDVNFLMWHYQELYSKCLMYPNPRAKWCFF